MRNTPSRGRELTQSMTICDIDSLLAVRAVLVAYRSSVASPARRDVDLGPLGGHVAPMVRHSGAEGRRDARDGVGEATRGSGGWGVRPAVEEGVAGGGLGHGAETLDSGAVSRVMARSWLPALILSMICMNCDTMEGRHSLARGGCLCQARQDRHPRRIGGGQAPAAPAQKV